MINKRRKPSGATWAFMCLSLPLTLEALLLRARAHPTGGCCHFLFFFSFASLASSASCWSLLNFIFFLPSGVLKYQSWDGREAGVQSAGCKPSFPLQFSRIILPGVGEQWVFHHSRGFSQFPVSTPGHSASRSGEAHALFPPPLQASVTPPETAINRSSQCHRPRWHSPAFLLRLLHLGPSLVLLVPFPAEAQIHLP